MQSSSKRAWHTSLLAAVVFLWAIWSGFGVIVALANAPTGMLRLTDYFLFAWIPTFMAMGAYLLFKQSMFRFGPFVVLPLLYLGGALRLNPDLRGPSQFSTVAGYLSQFPIGYLYSAAFFVGCAVYCLYLDRDRLRRNAG